MARLIDQVSGQAAAWEALRSLRLSRRLPHALAFTGPPGIGKKKVAWALAQALTCTAPVDGEACGSCGACRRTENRQSESVLYIEPSGPAIKIEAAHQVLEFLSLARLTAVRVVIIDGAHLANPQTANALLKVVEEPPVETHFILIVPEISQLLPTLRSRAQVLRFQPLSEQLLSQGEPGIEPWMLRSARGSFERLAQFQDEETNDLRKLAFEFFEGALQGRRPALIHLLENTKDRESAHQAIRFLQQALRDWTVVGEGELIHSDFSERWQRLPQVPANKKVELWRMALSMENDLHSNVDRTLLFENFYYRSRHALD